MAKTWSEFELKELGVDVDGAREKFNSEKSSIGSRLPDKLPDGTPVPDDHWARNVPEAKALRFASESVTPEIIASFAESVRSSVFAFITSQ